MTRILVPSAVHAVTRLGGRELLKVSYAELERFREKAHFPVPEDRDYFALSEGDAHYGFITASHPDHEPAEITLSYKRDTLEDAIEAATVQYRVDMGETLDEIYQQNPA